MKKLAHIYYVLIVWLMDIIVLIHQIVLAVVPFEYIQLKDVKNVDIWQMQYISTVLHM